VKKKLIRFLDRNLDRAIIWEEKIRQFLRRLFCRHTIVVVSNQYSYPDNHLCAMGFCGKCGASISTWIVPPKRMKGYMGFKYWNKNHLEDWADD